MLSANIWLYFGLIVPILAIILVLFYIIVTRRNNKNSQYPINDERLKRVTEKSAMTAYYVTMFITAFMMISLIIAYEFFKFGDLNTINVLMTEILLMGISYLIFYYYYQKKGTI